MAAAACDTPTPLVENGGASSPTPEIPWRVVSAPSLPEPIANNAVAASASGSRLRIFSFLGLGSGKDYRAITTRAWSLDIDEGRWERLPDVPGKAGRIAATAQSLGNRIYLFGGYEVAADGKETTSPALDIYDLATRTYSRGANIQTPVDDAVSGVWRDRLIFLVSGWSTDHNVEAVQFYDPAGDRWTRATPIRGTPVFGHAGAIVGDVIVYCGGARVQTPPAPKYAPNPECYRGDINPDNPSEIAWRLIAHHPGPARYRAAAGPVKMGQLSGVMFAGGTANPYNYNGVGYDGQPSEPEATTWIYDTRRDAWVEGPRLAHPTMDHRGLVEVAGSWWTIGGMGPAQAVSAEVARLIPPR